MDARGALELPHGALQPLDESWFPETISSSTFPGKLWHLVNSSAEDSIYWDVQGREVIVNQNMFVEQVLTPSGLFSDKSSPFKTKNFFSFVRQLNLYGFKKTVESMKPQTNRSCHHFFHPHFQRNHPELVCKLKRLTRTNRAKIQARLDVKSQSPGRSCPTAKHHADSGAKTNRGSPSKSAHPSNPREVEVPMLTGTPVPPRCLIRNPSEAFGLDILTADNHRPAYLMHHSSRPPLSTGVMHLQPVLMANHGIPNFTSFNHQNGQFQPSCYSSVWHLTPPCHWGLPTSMLSLQEGFQRVHPQTHSRQDLHNRGAQDARNSCVDLDRVFQIAEEVMQTPVTNRLAQVARPNDPELSSSTGDASGRTVRTQSVSDGSNFPAVCTVHTEQDGGLTPLLKESHKDAIVDVKDYGNQTEFTCGEFEQEHRQEQDS